MSEGPYYTNEKKFSPEIKSSHRKRKFLTAAFNMAAGVAATAIVKTAIVSMMTWATAPAVLTLAVSSLAVAAAGVATKHFIECHRAKKRGATSPKLFSRENKRMFVRSSIFALIGGGIFLGFNTGAIQHIFGSGTAHAAHTVVPLVHPAAAVPVHPVVTAPVHQAIVSPAMHPAVIAAPVAVPAHCPSVFDAFNEAAKGHHLSHHVQQAMHRALSSNAHVAAQGTKDLGYYAMNGFGGVSKNTHLAAELFQKAAIEGSIQGKTDLLYMQYHGLGGIVANKTAAMTSMATVNSHHAASLATHWYGKPQLDRIGKPDTGFSVKAIMQGFKPRCQ